MNPRAAFSPAPSRRRFLSRLAFAGAALPLVREAAAAESKRKAAAAAALPAWTGGPTVMHVFTKPLHWMSWADTAALVKAAGYDGLDYTVRVPQGHVLPERVEEDLPRAVEAARAAGLKVEMITTEINGLKTPHAEKIVRTAARLGVKYYRLGFFNYDLQLGVKGTLDSLKPQLRDLAALNQSVGIHGAIQNHAGPRVGGPMWDLYELLREIDPRWLGVQFDIRHAVAEAGQSWPLTLRLLAPWIKCTDLKDFRWEQSAGKAAIDNVPIGEGVVPYEAYFKLVRELGLNGPASVHFEYPPFERSPMSEAEKRAKFPELMRKDRAALKAVMAKAGVS
jgi:sugar phosphate isomerase/epimerase